MTDARVLKAMVVSAMATYVLLLAVPEPVLTKSVTLVLTAYMVAYLGAGPFLDLVRACVALRAETQRATTYTALEEAGARFGRVIGSNGARIIITLVAAALGGKAAGLATRGPGLPGTLLNEINSIAPSNPRYAALLRRGLQLLESIGYKGD